MARKVENPTLNMGGLGNLNRVSDKVGDAGLGKT
jgi:hypothetical protein